MKLAGAGATLLMVIASAFPASSEVPSPPSSIAIEGRSFLVDGKPLRQFTLFAAPLRDEETLRRIFRETRARGYNCARVGSETADWNRKTVDGHELFAGLRGPEPGTPDQLENLDRVVRVAREERMALEVIVIFTIKERPMREQIEHARRTASRLRDEPHVFFSAVNEPWAHSNLEPRNVNRLLRVLKKEAPARFRGVDERGDLAPRFRYDASLCDFIAYHWPRHQGWERAPGLTKTVQQWQKPILLNETMCYQSEETQKEFAPHPLCRTEQENFEEMMRNIYRKGAYGCFHSAWGIRAEKVGFLPDVRSLKASPQDPGIQSPF